MLILIAEDEPLTAQRLRKMTASILGDNCRFSLVDTVVDVIHQLEQPLAPDLLLLDIHLADGSSLELFNLTDVRVPVIFTTAYDEHAVRAFRLNAVDYLLKPIKIAELTTALNKWQTLPQSSIDYRQLAEVLKKKQSFNRFLIRTGQQLHLVESKEVASFFTEDRTTLLITFEGKKFVIDQSLDRLEEELDKELFFRVNRQYIVNRHAIKELFAFSKSRVKLFLQPGLETVVSTERSPHFKEWLVGGK